PKQATTSAMSEITGAIISITLVMSAVFLPIGFMEGSTGVFYRQFAFTLAIAIVISAVNALTLSPALCALFLKPAHEPDHEGKQLNFKERFFAGFNIGFERLTKNYIGSLRFLVKFKWLSLSALALVIIVSVIMIRNTQTGFIPSEDQGFIAVSLSMPAGASLDRTSEALAEAEKQLQEADFTKTLNIIAGFNILTQSTSPSSGVAFILLKPHEQRGDLKDINAIMGDVTTRLNNIKGANFFVFTFPTVPGFSNVDGLDMVLQDRTGGELSKFSGIGQNFIGELMKRPEIMIAFSTFKADYPQYELHVDDIKAEQLGVSTKSILQTMQAYFGSTQASDFNRFGKYYRVVVQADINDRTDPSALDGVFVKNRLGDMVPINTLVKLERVYGPET